MLTELTTQTLIPPTKYAIERVLTVLARWHDDQGHTGTVDYCYEQPCHALVRAMYEGYEDHRDCSDIEGGHDCADECSHSCRRCGGRMKCPNEAEHAEERKARIGGLDITAKDGAR